MNKISLKMNDWERIGTTMGWLLKESTSKPMAVKNMEMYINELSSLYKNIAAAHQFVVAHPEITTLLKSMPDGDVLVKQLARTENLANTYKDSIGLIRGAISAKMNPSYSPPTMAPKNVSRDTIPTDFEPVAAAEEPIVAEPTPPPPPAATDHEAKVGDVLVFIDNKGRQYDVALRSIPKDNNGYAVVRRVPVAGKTLTNRQKRDFSTPISSLRWKVPATPPTPAPVAPEPAAAATPVKPAEKTATTNHVATIKTTATARTPLLFSA
jgi:hypothetical protein